MQKCYLVTSFVPVWESATPPLLESHQNRSARLRNEWNRVFSQQITYLVLGFPLFPFSEIPLALNRQHLATPSWLSSASLHQPQLRRPGLPVWLR